MEEYGVPKTCTFTCTFSGTEEKQENHVEVLIGTEIRKQLDDRIKLLPLTIRGIAARVWANQPFRAVLQKTAFEINASCLTTPVWGGFFADKQTSAEFLYDGESQSNNVLCFACDINKAPVVVVGDNLKVLLLFYDFTSSALHGRLTVELDFFVGHQEMNNNKNGKKWPMPIVSTSLVKSVSFAVRRLGNGSQKETENKKTDKKAKGNKKNNKKPSKGKRKAEKKKKVKSAKKKTVVVSAADIANRFAELQSQIKL